MSTKLELPRVLDLRPRLTVIGVGGAGCNAVNNMIASGLSGVDFVAANTDAQALANSAAEHKLQLGARLTEGLGAGSKPEIGEAAAEEAIEDIRSFIAGSHMVFIAAGMGGGTGTGAASVIARVSKELGILTVGVVTKPFLFEGARRMRIADAGAAELKKHVDTLIVIPNQNLFRVASEKTTFSQAFVMADQVLYSGVACIVDLIIKEGLINLDFADVRTVMSGMGSAMMGTGEASGERRATLAAEEAIANPLLDDVSLRGAKGILLSIIGGHDLTLYDVDEAASRVRQEVDPEATIIIGATFDDKLGDRVRVSIVASGMDRPDEMQAYEHVDVQTRAGRAASPAAVETSRGRESHAPQRQEHQPRANDDEMRRRLVDALQYVHGKGANTASTSAQISQRDSYDQVGAPTSREIWQAPGNVTIEELPPHLPGGNLPPPLPLPAVGYPTQRESTGFIPAPPAEARQPRRMPDVGDFPPLAQRAYRAGMSGDAAHMSAEDERRGRVQEDAPRRRGLFGRITDRVLGDNEQVARHDATRDSHATGSAERLYDDESEQDDGYGGQGQPTELPVFFRRERR